MCFEELVCNKDILFEVHSQKCHDLCTIYNERYILGERLP